MNRNIKKAVIVLGIFTVLVMTWIIIGGPFNTYYLIWNLILAWAPMFFSLIFISNTSKPNTGINRIKRIIIGLLWLFFFPNAVYIITDYIHLSNDSFYYPNPSYTPYSGLPKTLYNFDRLPWNNFFSIAFAVFIGCALSGLSLYLLHQYLEGKWGKGVGWGFVGFSHLLSGYAIYLGRFIRFNSWDVILNPFQLIQFFFNNITGTAIVFSFHFFVLSFFIYLIFYLFIFVGKGD